MYNTCRRVEVYGGSRVKIELTKVTTLVRLDLDFELLLNEPKIRFFSAPDLLKVKRLAEGFQVTLNLVSKGQSVNA